MHYSIYLDFTCGVLWGLILRSSRWWASVIAHLRELLLGVHWRTSGYHRHVLHPREVVRRHPWVGHGMRWQSHTRFGHRVQAAGRNVRLKKTWQAGSQWATNKYVNWQLWAIECQVSAGFHFKTLPASVLLARQLYTEVKFFKGYLLSNHQPADSFSPKPTIQILL